MAGHVIPQEPPIGKDWEEHLYREGCAVLQEEARGKLETLDNWLHARAPSGWRATGFRKRTVVCRFGEVVVQRRLYQDEGGGYHFLLDEYLGWEARRSATPSLQEATVALTARSSFREAVEVLERLTAGVLSAMTLQRQVQATAEKAITREREEVEACFGRGEVPEGGERVVPQLFVEADGLYVRLQRAEGAYVEVRTAIGYEGWERLAGAEERYRLVGKQVYCQADKRIDFWEGVSLAFGRIWDWSRIPLVVLNGDGAAWIDEGAEISGQVIRQLDGFHLARSCSQAAREGGAELYETIRRGDWAEARSLLNQSRPARGKGRAWWWVKKVIEERRGADWRVQTGWGSDEGRGLGTMEGNEAQLWARRLKGKGMSWSRKGARNMAKVLELVANGELSQWCGQPMRTPCSEPRPRPKRGARRQRDPSEWLQAGLPALYGPDASKPWAQALRQLAQPRHLLN